jgi:hypothetical protein
VGDGVFPSTGTSNPSLTIAALSFQAGDTLANDLRAVTMQVQSNVAWQGTGVQLNAQVPRLVRYVSGKWQASREGGMVDGNGGSRHIAYSSYTLPNAAEGALIGRVGDGGKPFLIGDLAQLPVSEPGELQLCINDDLTGQHGAGLTDNIGALTVRIEFGTV